MDLGDQEVGAQITTSLSNRFHLELNNDLLSLFIKMKLLKLKLNVKGAAQRIFHGGSWNHDARPGLGWKPGCDDDHRGEADDEGLSRPSGPILPHTQR